MTSDSVNPNRDDGDAKLQPGNTEPLPASPPQPVRFDAIDSAAEREDAPARTPETADEYFQRGLKSAQLGYPDRAAADFEEAAWLDPDNATIQFNLGTAYLSMGFFEQALVNFDRALALRPDESDALGNRAVAHTALGQDDQAAADIQRAIALGAPPDGLHAVINYVKSRRGTNTNGQDKTG